MLERDCDPVISGHGHFRSFSFFNNICIWHIRKKNIYLHLIKYGNMDKSIHSHLYHHVIGRLRGKREKFGITQVQLADLLKVNQTFISRVETCDRRLDIIELHHICQVLDVSFVDFIQEVDRDILSKGEGK